MQGAAQAKEAEDKVQRFVEIDDAEIGREGADRKKIPHEQHAQSGVKYVYGHAPDLLAQALEAAVHDHIGVHERHERGEPGG